MDDSFDDIFWDDVPAPSSPPGEFKGDADADATVEVENQLEQLKQIEERLEECDLILKQLSQFCKIKHQIETEGERIVNCNTKVKLLGSGHHLVLVSVKNEGQGDLTDFSLVLQWTNLATNYVVSPEETSESSTSSRIVRLPCLAAGSSYECDLLCVRQLRLPLLLRCDLVKTFTYVDPRKNPPKDISRTISVSVGCDLCTVYNLITDKQSAVWLPEQSNPVPAGRVRSVSFELPLARSLVEKLTETPPPASAAQLSKLFDWLFPSCAHRQRQMTGADDNWSEDFIVNGAKGGDLSAHASIQGDKIVVKIECTSDWIRRLREDLDARLSLALLRLSHCPLMAVVDLEWLRTKVQGARQLRNFAELQDYVKNSILPYLPIA